MDALCDRLELGLWLADGDWLALGEADLLADADGEVDALAEADGLCDALCESDADGLTEAEGD